MKSCREHAQLKQKNDFDFLKLLQSTKSFLNCQFQPLNILCSLITKHPTTAAFRILGSGRSLLKCKYRQTKVLNLTKCVFFCTCSFQTSISNAISLFKYIVLMFLLYLITVNILRGDSKQWWLLLCGFIQMRTGGPQYCTCRLKFQTCTHLNIQSTHTQIHRHTHAYADTHICTNTYAHTHGKDTNVQTHTHIHMQTQTHTEIQKHIWTFCQTFLKVYRVLWKKIWAFQ